MISSRCLSIILLAALSPLRAEQPGAKPGDNAALRYWSAFAQMQDSAVTAEGARELQAILDGTAPYSDVKYRDLVERNRHAVETLQRGTSLPECDWGLDYQLGSGAPVEYVRKALALGRLNVLYGFHQLITGDRMGGIRTLAAGVRFSHDVAAGGPLIAALAAKTLLVSHLRGIDFAAHMQPLSADERKLLWSELDKVGTEGVDWGSAIRLEFEVLQRSGFAAPAALQELYQKALRDASRLSQLKQAMASTSQPVAGRIPNPQRVVDQKRELNEKLQECRAMLRT